MRIGKTAGNIALLLMLSGSLFVGGKEVTGYVRTEEENEILREQVENPPGSRSGTAEAEELEEQGEEIDFRILKAVNPDIRGWIRIPDTAIDYPILIGEKEGEYLEKNFKGQEDPLGSVFSYVGTDLGGGSRIFLFAHNLISGQMFGGLKKFLEPGYAGEHRQAFLFTPGGCRKFRFQSAEIRRADQALPRQETDRKKVLTLITCRGGAGTDYRTVVNFTETEPEDLPVSG